MPDEHPMFDLAELVGRHERSDERAGLTDADREFLAGMGQGLSESTRNQRRYRIRARFREMLIDCILFQNLQADDIRKMFRGLFPNPLPAMDEEDYRVFAGVRGLFHVLFLGMGRELFLEALEGGIERALFRSITLVHGGIPLISVELNVGFDGFAPLDDLEERFDDGKPLTPNALEGLVLAGRISGDEFESYSNITEDESVLPTKIPEEWVEPTDD